MTKGTLLTADFEGAISAGHNRTQIVGPSGMNPQFYVTYLWLGVALSIPMAVYVIYKYVVAVRNRPRFQKSDVLFEERFASGTSMKNIYTQLGGAHNCLRLVITKDWLWVTSWLPFSLITTFHDLEHVIPRNGISAIEVEANSRVIRLTYSDQNGSRHLLKLIPKDSIGFMRALGALPKKADAQEACEKPLRSGSVVYLRSFFLLKKT